MRASRPSAQRSHRLVACRLVPGRTSFLILLHYFPTVTIVAYPCPHLSLRIHSSTNLDHSRGADPAPFLAFLAFVIQMFHLRMMMTRIPRSFSRPPPTLYLNSTRSLLSSMECSGKRCGPKQFGLLSRHVISISCLCNGEPCHIGLGMTRLGTRPRRQPCARRRKTMSAWSATI
jgi:hypothetical protein